MANRFRGEIVAPLGGRKHTLRLTMDALARLQDALGSRDLRDLGRRVGKSAGDPLVAKVIVAAGLGADGEAVLGSATASEIALAARALAESAFGKPAGPGERPQGGRVRADIPYAFAVAVRHAGIAPSEFWRMSLPEFVALFTAHAPAGDLPDGPELDALAAMFPDRKEA